MALVKSMRPAAAGEAGDTVIEGVIHRPESNERFTPVVLSLEHQSGCEYTIVDGNAIALDLHSPGNRVWLQPLKDNPNGYTHLLLSND